MKIKVIVAHPGQQHSYQMATALKRKGSLYKYITTVYNQKGSLTEKCIKFLKGNARKKAQARVCSALCEADVAQFCEWKGLLLLLLQRIDRTNRLYRFWADVVTKDFGLKVAKYAIKKNCEAVVVYDTQGSYLGRYLKKKKPGIKLIMDVSAANLDYMRMIYEQDMKKKPRFQQRLLKERGYLWDASVMKRQNEELQYPDAFVVPSAFVERSLLYAGIEKEKIYRCPYGVDSAQFDCKTYSMDQKGPLHFIYVGGVKELKGIAYLLDAFMDIPAEKASLTVVGDYNSQDEDIQPYLKRVDFAGRVLHADIPDLLKSADVFVFPSLGDSFALAALEAASTGLPLIVSENTGMSDLMTKEKAGFIIPIQSVEAIKEKVLWFVHHPEQIEPMGRAARKMALKYTWECYYDKMGETIQSIVECE